MSILGYRALTKIQSVVLIVIIVVAAVGGSAAYVFWTRTASLAETIRIGICADLDNTIGEGVYRAAVLAAEQVNAEGGVLGRNFTIVAEDDDDESPQVDLVVLTNTFMRLITVDKADYVIANVIGPNILSLQDICAEHKKIYLGTRGSLDNITQRVLDDYDRYKYYFKLWSSNSSQVAAGTLNDARTLAKLTGFTKIAFLGVDSTATKQVLTLHNNSLPNYGLSLVYSGLFPLATTDFTSYFAAIEASGAEILVVLITNQAAYPFVKEWHDRESPFVIMGGIPIAQDSKFWELTEGKAEYVSFAGVPALSGYPLTNKTLPTGEAYLQRWGTTIPSASAVAAYDGVRFILPGAIRRAGTTETEVVVKALETTNVETSMARHFVFASSHDPYIPAPGAGQPEEDCLLVASFQFQTNGVLVPWSPAQIREEAGGTYRFPPWKGPWGDRKTP